MGFNDTLRELLDQGKAVSRDLAAKAGEAAQDWSARSKGFAARAGAKVQELGEKGVIMLEIKQLESQAKKLLGLLGTEVYNLVERGETWNSDEPGIQNIIAEISSVKESIEIREEALKIR